MKIISNMFAIAICGKKTITQWCLRFRASNWHWLSRRRAHASDSWTMIENGFYQNWNLVLFCVCLAVDLIGNRDYETLHYINVLFCFEIRSKNVRSNVKTFVKRGIIFIEKCYNSSFNTISVSLLPFYWYFNFWLKTNKRIQNC